MKSPIKFLGGIAGAMTGGGGNSGTSNPGRIDIARALGQDYKSENFNHNRQLPGAIDHTTGMVNPQPNSSGMGGQDTTGLAVQPQQTTNVPPAASSLINPFSPEAQQNAQGMYGGMGQRQQSVGAPFMFADQNGDREITQADVIKARTKGYKK